MKKDPSTENLSHDFLQLAKTALTGRTQDIHLVIHRTAKKFKSLYPDLTNALTDLLHESPTRTTPLRKHTETPLPVDLDSRLQLLRLETPSVESEPILGEDIKERLYQVIAERKNIKALSKHGLHPTKSLLLTGPPGVGKTMAARWIAAKLNRPVLILDLAAVMSSFLGRTGNNIRFVLDYAKNTECVLLLDEFDSIAKRRDDQGEIGELKRLVTVLLQEIDDWPTSGLLVAATNHPDLLDPAIWRRFEVVATFKNPTEDLIEQQLTRLLNEHLSNGMEWAKVLSHIFRGRSFSDIEREINQTKKSAAIEDGKLSDKLELLLVGAISNLTHDEKVRLAARLYDSGVISQRRASDLTGIARETIRKNSKSSTSNDQVNYEKD